MSLKPKEENINNDSCTYKKGVRVYYVINARIPSEHAHGLQVAKMCEALAGLGQEVILILPKRFNSRTASIFEHYGLKNHFQIKKLPVIDLMPVGFPFAFIIESISFGISTLFYFLFKSKQRIYCRGEVASYLTYVSKLKKHKLFWETHIKPNNLDAYKKVLKIAKGIIVITRYYERELAESGLVGPEKIFYYPDGVDLEMFRFDLSKEQAREKLGLPKDKKIIMYVGSDLDWKGLSLLKESAKFFADNYRLFFVGKISKDNSLGDKAVFVGFKPHSEIPIWLKSADVLVMTGDFKSPIAKFYTSPIKLFEYLAAHKPIVAFDLPAFRDVLNEENSILINTGDPETLARLITESFGDEKKLQVLADKAFNEAEKFTWHKRAKEILNFISKQ